MFILSLNVSADSLTEMRKFPAAWIWKVSSEKNQVYLIGEMHTFLDMEEPEIDFELGHKIFNMVPTAFREAKKLEAVSSPVEKKLSDLLGQKIWLQLDATMLAAVQDSDLSAEKKSTLHNKLMIELDNQSPIVAEVSIRNISTLLYVKHTKPQPHFVQGLADHIAKRQFAKTPAKQFLSIESNTITDEVWRKTCSSPAAAQTLISAALSVFDLSIFWDTPKIRTLQALFQSTYESNDQGKFFMNYWLENYPGSTSLLACNIIPRNIVWDQKLQTILDSTVEPTAVFVGIAHLLGENGIIRKMQQNKSYRVERVYSLPDGVDLK